MKFSPLNVHTMVVYFWAVNTSEWKHWLSDAVVPLSWPVELCCHLVPSLRNVVGWPENMSTLFRSPPHFFPLFFLQTEKQFSSTATTFPSQSRPQTWPQYVQHAIHPQPHVTLNPLWLTSINVLLFIQRENVEGVSQPPNDDVIRELSRSLRQALGVSLFGIDVIINNQTGQHAVIDVNAFPGRQAHLGPVSLLVTL